MIEMKRFSALKMLIAIVTLLAGCTGSGSSAPPPTNVNAVAGDSSVTISWDMLPGVEYWIFSAAANSVTPQSCGSLPACQTKLNAVSPAVVAGTAGIVTPGFTTNGTVVGLTNGTTYSFTVNGRKGGGPGGPGSPSVSAIPRLAGNTWSVGTPLGVNDLHGVTYGTTAVAGVTGNAFVAVGANGALFSSPDGKIWTALVNPVPSVNLNTAVSYGSNYLAAGTGGVMLLSSDANAKTWKQQTTGTTNDLYALASNGAGGYVAVGAKGTIITSNGGAGWAVVNSGTLNNLYGVTYANSKYVAVGAAGTLLTSFDGTTWTSVVPQTLADLKGVAYGGASTTNGVTSGVNTFVAIGAAGTLVTSLDGGVTWALHTPISTLNLNAVTYGHQFVAVGDNGGIFTSTDGLVWQAQTPVTSATLYAVTHGLYDYSSAGGTGLNLYAM